MGTGEVDVYCSMSGRCLWAGLESPYADCRFSFDWLPSASEEGRKEGGREGEREVEWENREVFCPGDVFISSPISCGSITKQGPLEERFYPAWETGGKWGRGWSLNARERCVRAIAREVCGVFVVVIRRDREAITMQSLLKNVRGQGMGEGGGGEGRACVAIACDVSRSPVLFAHVF